MSTESAPTVDFRTYYDLDTYLSGTISLRFAAEHTLTAFDFFCIVIWKANRAKTKVAKRLLAHGKYPDLDSAVHALLTAVAAAPSPKDRLRVFMRDWGFRLPMASAILTVLYPNDFTVYDIRVCDMLSDFHSLANKIQFESIWAGYERYVTAVREKAPAELSLRDKDRWLWGKSFVKQLTEDIASMFTRPETDDES